MKRILVFLCATVLVLGMMGSASATLIGDTVTSQHFFTNLTSPWLNLETEVVAAGTSDLMYPHNGSYYEVNVEAFEILIDFTYPVEYNLMWTTAAFNGLVVDSLDDSSGGPLLGVIIDTNFVGWSESRLTFDSDTVFFNWNGLAFNSDTYMNATLDFGAPVPEPATMFLLGSGLIGLAGFSRKKFKK